MSLQFIVLEPYPGRAESFLAPSGEVAYSGGLDFAAYQASRPNDVLRVVSNDEFDEIEARHLASLITEPLEISEEQFWEALECMPPSRYQRNSGVEIFHICERITGNLVSWYGSHGSRYFTFNDLDDRPGIEISNKFKGATA